MIEPTNCCPTCGHHVEDKVSRNNLEVHYSPPLVLYAGEQVELTPFETRMLYQLVRRGTASYDQLAILPNGECSDNVVIRARIFKIRKKFRERNIPIEIINMHSYGYAIRKAGE